MAQPANQTQLTVATVDRTPFSFGTKDGVRTGFSIELMEAIAKQSDYSIKYDVYDSYATMLNAVKTNDADMAIANISVNREREEEFDFSHPIYTSSTGILINTQAPGIQSQLLYFGERLLLPFSLLLVVVWAFAISIWFFERRTHPYFNKPFRQALFPAFWWSLRSTVNNGGWDDEIPHSWQGRLLATLMLLTSLVGLTFFIGFVTAEQTVSRLDSEVNNVHDLNGKSVGAMQDSSNSAFLSNMNIPHKTFSEIAGLYMAFEEGAIEAVVYDTPMLEYHIASGGSGTLLPVTYDPNPYAILCPDDSPYLEAINTALLSVKENGTYSTIAEKYF